jgi:hypothetical protein
VIGQRPRAIIHGGQESDTTSGFATTGSRCVDTRCLRHAAFSAVAVFLEPRRRCHPGQKGDG